MLNLTQLAPQVKNFAAAVAERHASAPLAPYTRLAGPIDSRRAFARRQAVSHPQDASQMAMLYQALKALGWQSTGRTHPADRTALLAFAAATIRRDPDFTAGHWVVEINSVEHAFTGSPEAITAEVERLLASPSPSPSSSSSSPLPGGEGSGEMAETDDDGNSWGGKPLTPAQEEADGLKAEYPELAARVDAALALIESGELAAQQKRYGATWHNQTRHGVWFCGCPDSLHRRPTAKFGRACKHCLGGEILARVQRTANRIAQQKLGSDIERRSGSNRRETPPSNSPQKGENSPNSPQKGENSPNSPQRGENSPNSPPLGGIKGGPATEREQALPASATASTSILDWLDYGDDPRPAPRKSGADIIREIEAENAAKFAADKARYDAALRPDYINRKASHVYQVGSHLPR